MKIIIKNQSGKKTTAAEFETQADAVAELRRIAGVDLNRDDGLDYARDNGVMLRLSTGELLTPHEVEAMDSVPETAFVFPADFDRWDDRDNGVYWTIEDGNL